MKVLLSIVLAIGLIVAACDDDSPDEANAAFCQQLSELETAVTSVSNANTVDDLKAAGEQVKDEAEQVVDARGDVAGARYDALVAANSALSTAVFDIPNDQPLDEAKASLQDEVAAVTAARQAIGTEVGCG